VPRGSSSSVPIDRSFVAVRLAAAERLLAEVLAHVPDERLAVPDAVARERRLTVPLPACGIGVTFSAVRLPTPVCRVCRVLGHRWAVTGLELASVTICKRCRAVQD